MRYRSIRGIEVVGLFTVLDSILGIEVFKALEYSEYWSIGVNGIFRALEYSKMRFF
jgi:hypothetical protein